MPLHKYLKLTGQLLILSLTITANVAAAGLGKLSNVLTTGYNDGWNATLTADEYWLENTSQQGAIRYFYAEYDGQSHQRIISANVQLNATDEYSEAGLLYGFDNTARQYFIVSIKADGTFNVTHRDNNGFHLILQTSIDINPNIFNTILIKENGNQLSFSINGKNVGDLSHPSAGSGSVGIVAVGTGKFGFADFVEDHPRQVKGFSASEPTKGATATKTYNNPLEEPQISHSIKDEFGFEKPMEAMTIKMPESWDVNGAVQWYGKPSCTMDISLPKVHLKGTARNGMQWFEMIPGGIWAWNSNFDTSPQMRQTEIVGCDARPIVDIQTFVNQYIPAIRPNAKTNSMRPRPDIIQQLMKDQAEDIRVFQQQYPNMRLRPEAMEINLTYNANGKMVNELLETAVLFIDSPILDPYGGMSAVLTIAMAQGTVITATVEGQADATLLKTIGVSVVVNSQYQARLQQFMAQRTSQMAQATQRQNAANRAYRQRMASSTSANNTYSDILDSNMASWRRIQGMQDAGQSKLVDATLERTPWQTTAGETVYMPQQYQRVFQLPNGVYAGTNDNFFNPVNGAQLKQHQY